LIRIAGAGGTAEMKTLRGSIEESSAVPLFVAALRQDADRIREAAATCGADPEALQAVAALLPIPFLHACRSQYVSELPRAWVEGYCPLCGAPPVFAEVLGIERERTLRCGRCGVRWNGRPLQCPYCGNVDHHRLESLLPKDDAGARGSLEACRKCLGHVKVFTRLQGCHARDVMVEDLASVDLDLAAIELGYSRPTGAGYPLEMTISAADSRGGLLAWHR
jgi:FdhE protein